MNRLKCGCVSKETRRFIVLVLDGFGVGATSDAAAVRPQDTAANTCRSIFQALPELRLPNLERLGLANALGEELGNLKFSAHALYGTCALQHYGADTFYGHQEIMGTRPRKPNKRPFSEIIEPVRKALSAAGYTVEARGGRLQYLLVNGCATVADNIEADCGSAYNITATFDKMAFGEVLRIGAIVRSIADVSRVIAFGGENVQPEQLLAAAREKQGAYIGIDAPLSGVYNSGYLVRHLGYGINPAVQVPALLAERSIPTVLAGKVADIVENACGSSYSVVDTTETLLTMLRIMKSAPGGFICVNVQETDLAGHLQSADIFADKLKLVDDKIPEIIALLNPGDMLIVTADHGNDPLIGHSGHTRENTLLLAYCHGMRPGNIGERATLSDIGQTVCDFFGARRCENGESFLDKLGGRNGCC